MEKTRLAAEIERFEITRVEEQDRTKDAAQDVRRLNELELMLVGGGECNFCW